MLKPESYPAATESVYRMYELDQRIPLYQGKLRIRQGTISVEESGSIELRWLPTPRFEFLLPSMVGLGFALDDCIVELVDRGWLCEGGIVAAGSGGLRGHIEHISDPAGPIGDDGVSKVSQIRFCLPNFHKTGDTFLSRMGNGQYRGRCTIDVGAWRLAFDLIDSKICETLSASGGFAFTHVVACERIDRGMFAPEDANEILRHLDLVLSFCLGRWTGGALLTGHELDGKLVWEQWRLPWLSSFKYEHSWFPKRSSSAVLEKLTRGFVAACAEPVVERSLTNCVHWYIEANRLGGGLEGAIVMSLVGLELLAWLQFVNRGGENREKFEKEKAHNKIRRYLSVKGVPFSSTSLPALEAFITDPQSPCVDGVEAVTRIRNRTVHPPSGSAFREFPIDLLEQAWRLCVFLLERSILAELQYDGPMLERLGWTEIVVRKAHMP